MPTPNIQTWNGCKVIIVPGQYPANDDWAGFVAGNVSRPSIGNVVSVGQVGDTASDVTADILSRGRTQHISGALDGGTVEIQIAGAVAPFADVVAMVGNETASTVIIQDKSGDASVAFAGVVIAARYGERVNNALRMMTLTIAVNTAAVRVSTAGLPVMLAGPTASPLDPTVGDNVTLTRGTYSGANTVTGRLMQGGVDRTGEINDDIWSPGVAGGWTWTVTATGDGGSLTAPVVSGAVKAPVTIQNASYAYADKDTPYTGTADNVTAILAQGTGGLTIPVAASGTGVVTKTATGFRFSGSKYLTIAGITPNSADGAILLVEMTPDGVTGTQQGINYGANLTILRLSNSTAQAAYADGATPTGTNFGTATAGAKILMAVDINRAAQTATTYNPFTKAIVTVARAVGTYAPTALALGQSLTGEIHRFAVIPRPAGGVTALTLEEALAAFASGGSVTPAFTTVSILQSRGQSQAQGRNMGAVMAPNGIRWRDVLKSDKVRGLTGMVRATDGVPVSSVAAPLLAGYNRTVPATGEGPMVVSSSASLGVHTSLALVRDTLPASEVIAFQFHDAGGLSVLDIDDDPATGDAGLLTPYQNAGYWLSEASRIYKGLGKAVTNPWIVYDQGSADVGMARGVYAAAFRKTYGDMIRQTKAATGQTTDPRLFLMQEGGYMNKTTPQLVALDDLDIIAEWNGILVGPAFQFLIDNADGRGIHMSTYGNVGRGEISAWAISEVRAGRAWNLLPGAATRAGNRITIPVSIRSDETLTTVPGKYADYGGDPANLGLEVVGGGSITAASVSGGNIILDVTGTVTAVRHAMQTTGIDYRNFTVTVGNELQGYAAHRSLIRTTLTKQVAVGGLAVQLERWVPSFEVTV